MKFKQYISFIQFLSIYLNKIISKFNKTALFHAIELEDIEIVKLLLSNDKIDPNIYAIFSCYSYNFKKSKFLIIFFFYYLNEIFYEI